MGLKVTSFSNIRHVVAFVVDGGKAAVLAGAEATTAEARREIETQVGSGRKYPGLPKQSSAPGEHPVNQMQELLESIHTDPKPDAPGIAAAAVAESDHAAFLELGTSKMAPRPFMGPAAEVGEVAMQKVLRDTAAGIGA